LLVGYHILFRVGLSAIPSCFAARGVKGKAERMKPKAILVALLMLGAFAALTIAGVMPRVVTAQNATSSATTSSVVTATLPPDQLNITWPVSVTELWDVQMVQGTVAIPDLDHYLLEWQPLNADLSLPAGVPWTPASGVQTKTVRDGELATVDTTGIPDGLYSLRLSAFNKAGANFLFVVTPLRVSNARFAAIFALTATPTGTRRARTPLPQTPATGVVLNGIALIPANPVCSQTYSVQVNVNNPTTTNTAPGTVTVQDINVRTGDITTSGTGNFPAIAPGQNSVVTIQLTTTQFYNETHQVLAFTGNSQIAATYALQQGACNVTLTPSQTFTAVPPTAIPPTAVPPTAIPPTAVPPTVIPPTAIPPTAIPPTATASTAAASPTVAQTTEAPPTATATNAPPTATSTTVSPTGTPPTVTAAP
jgi:hypothetical protein